MIGANNKQGPVVLPGRGGGHWFHQALLDSQTHVDLYLSPHITLTDAAIPVESFAFCCIIPPAGVSKGGTYKCIKLTSLCSHQPQHTARRIMGFRIVLVTSQ